MTRVAFPTEDGKTISQHFGQAPMFVVATIQEADPVKFEQREKGFHRHQLEQYDHEHGLSGHNHSNMLSPIGDCQVLIAGGMGQPAYESAMARGLQVILTDEITIEAALNAYLAGKLLSDPRRVHKHRQNNPSA